MYVYGQDADTDNAEPAIDDDAVPPGYQAAIAGTEDMAWLFTAPSFGCMAWEARDE